MKRELCFLSSENGRGQMRNESRKNKFVSNFFFFRNKKNQPRMKDEYNI